MGKLLAILIILVSLVLIMLYPIPAGGRESLEGKPYEGYAENYTLFVGKWDHTCLTYWTDDPGLAALVDQSLHLWGSVSTITNCGNVPETVADITVRGVPNGSLGSNVLGQAGCAGIGGFIVDCNVLITDGARFLGVVAHEIGHALGLGHSSGRADEPNPLYRGALMYYRCCNDLNADDAAGIQFLYGARPGPTPTATPVFFTPVPTATVSPTPIPAPVIYRRWLPGLTRD